MLSAAILTGGLATRLRPLTETIPKALVEINGEPFVSHQLELLHSRGIRRVVMCVGHLGEMIRDYVGDGSRFGLDVSYSFDGPVLRGTAGALQQALPLLGDPLFVVYGDSYLPCDYAEVERVFAASGKQGLMTVYRNVNQFDTSNVEYSEGRIVVYDKKVRTPKMQHIDYGLGVFRREVFAGMPAGGVRDLADVYRELLETGQLAACEVAERFYEIGSVAGIADLSGYLSSMRGTWSERDQDPAPP
jgi:NDP-sugar pyrophosphorylase family protein